MIGDTSWHRKETSAQLEVIISNAKVLYGAPLTTLAVIAQYPGTAEPPGQYCNHSFFMGHTLTTLAKRQNISSATMNLIVRRIPDSQCVRLAAA